jgi:hypothetical protein
VPDAEDWSFLEEDAGIDLRMQGSVGSTEDLSRNGLCPGSSCRLVLQPHGFEGLLTGEEDANVADLAVDQVVHVGLAPCQANTAGAASGASVA